MLESKTWAIKARDRKLISPVEFEVFLEKLQTLHHKLNIYIKKLKQEPPKTD
ncbi:MAG: hypothetical protein IPM36_02765 [Lewinellaceae bacterium]|nr:hypothetical protein [Lewinellaceae bacterium]